jgi:hypothetical protein
VRCAPTHNRVAYRREGDPEVNVLPAAEISASQHSLRPSFTAVNQRFSFLATRRAKNRTTLGPPGGWTGNACITPARQA